MVITVSLVSTLRLVSRDLYIISHYTLLKTIRGLYLQITASFSKSVNTFNIQLSFSKNTLKIMHLNVCDALFYGLAKSTFDKYN